MDATQPLLEDHASQNEEEQEEIINQTFTDSPEQSRPSESGSSHRPPLSIMNEENPESSASTRHTSKSYNSDGSLLGIPKETGQQFLESVIRFLDLSVKEQATKVQGEEAFEDIELGDMNSTSSDETPSNATFSVTVKGKHDYGPEFESWEGELVEVMTPEAIGMENTFRRQEQEAVTENLWSEHWYGSDDIPTEITPRNKRLEWPGSTAEFLQYQSDIVAGLFAGGYRRDLTYDKCRMRLIGRRLNQIARKEISCQQIVAHGTGEESQLHIHASCGKADYGYSHRILTPS